MQGTHDRHRHPALETLSYTWNPPASDRSNDEAYIGANPATGVNRQRWPLFQPSERADRSQPRSGTQQFRREVDKKFVDQTSAQQRTIQSCAGLDMDFQDTLRREVCQHAQKIDLTIGSRLHSDGCTT